MFQTWIVNIVNWLVNHNDVERARHAVAIMADSSSIDRLSLLHIAAQNGNPAMVEMLLDMGANVNHTITSQAFTPLHMAMTEGYVTYTCGNSTWSRIPGPRPASVIGDYEGVTHVLLRRGAAVNQPTRIDQQDAGHLMHGGNTALCMACYGQNINLIRLLLEAGADVAYQKPSSGYTPLFLSIWPDPKPSELLLSYPDATESLQIKAKNGRTCLMEAAAVGQCALIRRIVSAWPEMLDMKTNCGNRALMYACAGNQAEVVKLLLELGADPNMPNSKGIVPLMHTVSCGNKVTTRLLLKHGADPNKRMPHEYNDRYLLIEACNRSHPELIPLLLKYGAVYHINATDDSGETAIFYAASLGQTRAVKTLIAAGANVNIADSGGITPLHQAAWLGFRKIVKLLIRAGADMERKTDNGKTPLMYMLPLDSNGIPTRAVRVAAKIKESVQAVTEEFNPLWVICPSPPEVVPFVAKFFPSRNDICKILRYFIDHGLKKRAAPLKTFQVFINAGYPVVKWIKEFKLLHCARRQATPVILQYLRHAYYRPELNGIPGGPGFFKAVACD
jgi:ankyrin repeat protein